MSIGNMTIAEFEATYGCEVVPHSFVEHISCGADIAKQVRGVMREEQETFVLLTLNSKHEVIRIIPLFIGTVNQCIVHPRDIFREAVRDNAVSIAMAHNHPAGSLEFSAEDKQVHRKIKAASEVMDIRLLDFLVVTKVGWISIDRV